MLDEATEQGKPGLGAYAIAAFFTLLAPAAAGGALALAAFQGVLGVLGAPLRGLIPRSPLLIAFLLSLFGFAAWAALTSLWSPYSDHGQALRTLAGFACGVLFVAGAGATPANRRLVRAAGAAGLIVLMALLLIEAFAGLPLNQLAQPDSRLDLLARNPARGLAVLVCLAWAGVAALAEGGAVQRFGWRLLAIGAAIAALQFDMNACALAFGAGLIAYLIGLAAPRWGVLALCVLLALWLLAAPWVIGALPLDPAQLEQFPDSWRHRVEIWRYAAAQVPAEPGLGWGMDSARTFDAKVMINGQELSLISLHPHSASLQIWLETGAVGAGLGALALILGGLSASRALAQHRLAAAGACGALAAFGLMANLSFGVWQEWWVATAFAAAALVSATRR